MSIRVLVTGSAGLLGGVLVKALAASGFDVIATARRPTSDILSVPYFGCDLSDAAAVSSLLARARPEVIVHAAGRIRTTGAILGPFVRDNILATANLLDGSRTAPVHRFIHISTISVYSGDGPFTETSATAVTDPYGWSKRKAEELCLGPSVPNVARTILRLGGLHGYPRGDGLVYEFVRRASKDEAIFVDEPETQISLTFLDDVASVVGGLLIGRQAAHPTIYNVASSDSVTLRELAEIVRAQTGTAATITLAAVPKRRNRVLDTTKLRTKANLQPLSLHQSLENAWRRLAKS